MPLDKEALNRYNALKTEFDGRYDTTISLLASHPLHFATYLRGYLVPSLPDGMELAHYDVLQPFVDKWDGMLNALLEEITKPEGKDVADIAA